MREYKTTAPVIRMLGVNVLPDPIVDRSVNGITYYGYAPLGVDESDEGWLIVREITANNITTVEYAMPDPEGFSHSWTSRSSYFASGGVMEGYLYNGEFYEDSGHSTALPHDESTIYIDVPTGTGYQWNGASFEEASSGGGGGVSPASSGIPLVTLTYTAGSTYALDSEKMYVLDCSSASSGDAVTFTFNAPASGLAALYDVVVKFGNSLPTITWPSHLTWQGGSAPTLSANTILEINAANGLAIAAEF